MEAEQGHTPEANGSGSTMRVVRRRSREWLTVVFVALLAALLIRSFGFQAFRIPTPSMEKNLLVGDFVVVSKLHYGPRTPITLGLPLTNLYLTDFELPPLRFPGFTPVQRGDVIVFNYPVEQGPIDRKTHYIKRAIGLPGDTLSIVGKVPYVGAEAVPLNEGMQQKWLIRSGESRTFPVDRLRRIGAEQITMINRGDRRIAFEATEAVAAEVQSWDDSVSVEPFILPRNPGFGLRVFPFGSGFGRDQYGPLYIPARGDTLHLTEENWPAYEKLITRYEKHRARALGDGVFEIDDVLTDRYVVEQDYFFVLGDNRDSSSDSRVWGFVPMSHVVGKATMVYFSWDEEANRPRYNRLFMGIR